MSRYSDATQTLESAFLAVVPKPKKNKPPSKAEWAQALEQFNTQARAVRTQYRLGLLGRAIVAYRLQPRLIAAGYSPDVVRQILFSMVLHAFVG
ncbi:MAG: hypothetical protein V4627_19550 [Pseudomonadota bacterium]